MARDRSIKLIISAQVDGAKRALKETADAAKAVGDETEKSSQRSTSAAGRLVQSARDNAQAWNTVGTTVTGVGVALTAGFGAAVSRTASFEKSMSGVQAVTNASASEMDALTQAALDMGAQTAFSASEAAIAQGELARAGVSTADILGGALQGSMDLAAAGGLELADAAIISAQAMNLFGLAGSDVSHIADVLASGANKSAADVSDLGMALSQAGTVASQTGLSLEETVAALSMFADAGIRGSDAGTSLKSMLQRLTPQSKEAQAVMDELGFSAYDAQGNFIGLEELAGELQSSFGGLDTESRQAALGVAFGSDAIRAASVLMSGGAEAAREYEDAMNDQGAAARMAGTMMDNLAGDWEELGGAIETALIQGGTASNDFLRKIVQGATGAVNAYNELPGPVQASVTAIAGLGGVAATATGALILLVPRAVETYDAFRRLSDVSPRLATNLGRVGSVAARGGALAVGLYGIGTIVGQIAESSERGVAGVNEFESALMDLQTTAGRADLDSLFSQMDAGRFADNFGIDSFADALDRVFAPERGQQLEAWSRGLFGVTDSGDRARAALAQLDAVLAGYATTSEGAEVANDLLADALRGTGYSTADVMEVLPQYRDALAGVDNEARKAAEGAAELTPEVQAQEEATKAAAEALAEYQAELAGISGSFIDGSTAYEAATAAAQAWAQGQADATDSTEDSWEDFVSNFTGTTDEYLAELRRMAESQTAWEENLLGLIARGVPAEFVTMLAEMGPGAAEQVALVADMTDAELAEWVELMGQRGGEGVSNFAVSLTDANTLAVLTAAGEQLGGKAVDGLVQKLLAGEITLQQAIDEYDLDVELGAETAPFEEEAAAAMAEVEGKKPTPKVDADTSPAKAKSQEWEFDTSSMRPVPKVDSDTSAATSRSQAWRDYTQSQRPVPYVDANTSRAFSATSSWRAWAAALSASPSVSAATGTAYSAVTGLLGWISSRSASVNVTARYAGGLNVGGSDRTRVSARAAGGVERRPMMMGPGYGPTNVILAGEPETRGEAFISNHPAYKSQNIEYLRTAAAWFGLDVVKAHAAGGVHQRWMTPASAPAPVASLAGARITGTLQIGGDGLARIIDGRILEADERGAYHDRRQYGHVG